MRFYEQFYGFHALRTVGKCTSRHLFRYGLSPLGQVALLMLAATSVVVVSLKASGRKETLFAPFGPMPLRVFRACHIRLLRILYYTVIFKEL